jgi:hypothetical protein
MSPSSNGGTTLMSPQVRPYTFKEHVDPNDPISRPGTVPPPVPPKDDRKCGMKKRTYFIMVGCILIWVLALALGLGLGLGLGLKKSNSYVHKALAAPPPADSNQSAGTAIPRILSAARSQSIALVARSMRTTYRRRARTMARALHWLESRGTLASGEFSRFTFSTTRAISASCSTPPTGSGLAGARLRRSQPTQRMVHLSLLLHMPSIPLNT